VSDIPGRVNIFEIVPAFA